ncbi:hypothetical protein [Sphingomonas koreensis]|nr:hypothetical protein [Sphingomonas koreensis]
MLLLVETTGLAEPVAALLVALAAERRRCGDAVIFVCTAAHVDFIAALLGTGSTFLCEPTQDDIDRALKDVVRRIWQRRMRGGSLIIFNRPCWLDILSDALTNLAIAQQANDRQASMIVELLDQMIAGLLALPSDRALLGAVEIALQDEGTDRARATSCGAGRTRPCICRPYFDFHF